MKQLANGCKRSNLYVFPKNWKTKKASARKNWHIRYRFYFPDGTPHTVTIRNMNTVKALVMRQDITGKLIANELDLLDNKGYNPVLKAFAEESLEEVSPATLIKPALEVGYKSLSVDSSTRRDVKYALAVVTATIEKSPLGLMRVGDVEPQHIFSLLKRIEDDRKLSPVNYNHYRAYLMMIFKQLFILGAVKANPVRDIPKKKVPKKKRDTLTPAQRRAVNDHLLASNYNFWRYMHIFFHSGGRSTELLSVKAKDVSLQQQRYKVMIKKGGQLVEDEKTIKDIALPLWEELLRTAGPNDYIFGRELKPGPVPHEPDSVSKYWRKKVKKHFTNEKHGFVVTADFYSLKHSNTSEMVDALNDADAAKLNSHASTAMVVGIYDTQRAKREHERIKGVNNPFV